VERDPTKSNNNTTGEMGSEEAFLNFLTPHQRRDKTKNKSRFKLFVHVVKTAD
jgi:hypothetical protein